MEPAEVFRLTLAILVMPVFLSFARRLRGASWIRPMIAAYTAITFSYVMSILEALWAPELFNTLQHFAYLVAGVFWVLVVLDLRRSGYFSGAGR